MRYLVFLLLFSPLSLSPLSLSSLLSLARGDIQSKVDHKMYVDGEKMGFITYSTHTPVTTATGSSLWIGGGLARGSQRRRK